MNILRAHEHLNCHSHEHLNCNSYKTDNDLQFTLIGQYETQEQLKEREIFWQHRLKAFYPYGLNEKKEY